MASPVGSAIKTALETAVTGLTNTTNKAQTSAGSAIEGINWQAAPATT